MTLFEFDDYRKYINAYMKGLPRRGHGEVNKLAAFLNVNSTLVSQVLNYKKDFTLEQSMKLSDYFHFNQLEADYFLSLVQIERAGTVKLKDFFKGKAKEALVKSQEIKNRISSHQVLDDKDKIIFYSSWIYSATRLYCSLGDGKTKEEISTKFSLTAEKTTEVLDFLVRTGLCHNENHIFKIGTQKTHLEQGSPFLSKHYLNWKLKGIERIDNLQKEELMFSAPFSVSRADFLRLKDQMLEFIKILYETASKSDPEDLACINIDLFFIE